jgi:hypothetical protein
MTNEARQTDGVAVEGAEMREGKAETSDTDRLDFLQSQLGRWGDCFAMMNLDDGSVYPRPWRYANQTRDRLPAATVYPTIRQAIDGAMRGEPTGLLPPEATP